MKYCSYIILTWIFNILPRPLLVAAARIFGSISHACSAKKRTVIHHNLTSLKSYSPAELHRISKKIFQNFCICFVDFCRFTHLTKDQLLAITESNDLEILYKTMNRNKGLIALSAHVGHWELAAISLALRIHKTHVIYHQYDDLQTARFFNRIRHPVINWIQAGKNIRKLRQIIDNKEIIATAVDINFFKEGVMISFLGKPKLFPLGPALLSYHSGAPVITAHLLLSDRDKQYKTVIDQPIIPNTKADKNEEIIRITKCIARNLEINIRKYPDQWFIFQNFQD